MFELFKVDDQFLADLGLADLSTDEKEKAINSVRTSLESRVGIKLTHGMSESQLNEFNNLLSGDDPKAAMDWIEKNLPNYRDVVAQELDAIVDQVRHNNLAFINRL